MGTMMTSTPWEIIRLIAAISPAAVDADRLGGM